MVTNDRCMFMYGGSECPATDPSPYAKRVFAQRTSRRACRAENAWNQTIEANNRTLRSNDKISEC